MNIFKVCILSSMLGISATPLLAQTTIVSPTNGQQVSSTFTLNMWADSCDGNAVGSVGYSLDNSSSTSAWSNWYIDGPVAAPSGWHTLHVKVWDVYGDPCVTDVPINVSGGGASGNSTIPSNAIAVGGIQTFGWNGEADEGTPGWASGTTYVTGSPSTSGASRLFANQFWNYGGERYATQVAGDVPEQNYFYDAWVYIAGDASGMANLEFDLNHTMDNGITAIMGFQCDGWTSTWDYTVNAGSPTDPWDVWLHSNAPCNVQNWGANQWHHVQISFSHDGNGWVTYHSVWLDGNEQDLNYGVFSGFQLGWTPGVIANFQLDGNNGDTSWGNVYLDNVTVYRW